MELVLHRLSTFLIALLPKVATALATKAVVALFEKPIAALKVASETMLLLVYPPAKISRFHKDQQKDLARMPFIYRGVETSTYDDFVHVKLRLLASNLDETSIKDSESLDFLRDARLVVVIGDPGIGKSTLQRNTALKILRKQSTCLYPKEDPIVLYVPLKVIPNEGDAPLYDYICQGAPFRGDKALLTRTFSERGLFLFLDGYDEIQAGEGGRSAIATEIKGIFAIERSELSLHPLDGLRNSASRVWLSSRRQFLSDNPIGGIGQQGGRDFTTKIISLGGIGNQRRALAKILFDRYAKTRSGDTRLDADVFLTVVDKLDDESRWMSYNPLFLTVMCYQYADGALRGKNPEDIFSASFESLLQECIELLLKDLDEDKVRGISNRERAALKRSGNQFLQAKRQFLRYLAGQSYLKPVGVYRLGSLADLATEFISEECDDDDRSDLNRSLFNDSIFWPSFIRELVYSGLITSVQGSPDCFDFPHIRFKEVLAVAYYSDVDKFVRLVERIGSAGQPSFQELLSVLFRSRRISSNEMQQAVFRKIVDRSRSHNFDMRPLAALCEMLPSTCDVDTEVWSLLERLMDSRHTPAHLPPAVLRRATFDRDRIEKVSAFVQETAKEGDVGRFQWALELLGSADTVAHEMFCQSLLISRRGNPKIWTYAYRLFWFKQSTSRPELVKQVLHEGVNRLQVLAAVLALAGIEDSSVMAELVSAFADQPLLLTFAVARHIRTNHENFTKFSVVMNQSYSLEQLRAALRGEAVSRLPEGFVTRIVDRFGELADNISLAFEEESDKANCPKSTWFDIDLRLEMQERLRSELTNLAKDKLVQAVEVSGLISAMMRDVQVTLLPHVRQLGWNDYMLMRLIDAFVKALLLFVKDLRDEGQASGENLVAIVKTVAEPLRELTVFVTESRQTLSLS